MHHVFNCIILLVFFTPIVMREFGLWFAFCAFSGLGFKQVGPVASSYEFLLAGIVLCRACQVGYKLYSAPSPTHLLGHCSWAVNTCTTLHGNPSIKVTLGSLKGTSPPLSMFWNSLYNIRAICYLTLNKKWLYNYFIQCFSSSNASMIFLQWFRLFFYFLFWNIFRHRKFARIVQRTPK